jgi:two-component system, OmpR family, sensor histidine kinase BaeS
MKSITFKLILAFLCISLVTVLVVVITSQRSTDREFNQFLLTNDQETITKLFTNYYTENQSWKGLAQAAPGMMADLKIHLDNNGRLPFTLTDASYNVILAGGMYRTGDVLLSIDQSRSYPIQFNGNNVGYLDIRTPIPVPQPARDLFIQRMRLNMIIFGSAAILLSLVLGFIFSRIISSPLRELTTAAMEVSKGNLNQKVRIRSRDEIGELARVFNEMTEKLDNLLKSQKQMTADIAHELRTPISVILGHAEGIHDGVIPASPETMEIIREESIRLEHLVNDLRMLALSDAGELELKLMLHAPSSLIDQAYDHFNYQAQSYGVTLSRKVTSDLPEVLIDMDRMTQVFSNLLENAMRNTPSGGEIILGAAADGNNAVELTVTDTGYGIKKEDLEKIFDRLYRTDQSREKDKGGTGLGLALAKTIIEQHGGKIRAESEPGMGTKMVIRLPVGIKNGE